MKMKSRIYVGKPYTRKFRLRDTREFVATKAYLKLMSEILYKVKIRLS